MKTQTIKNLESVTDEGTLKAIALKQFNQEDFFIVALEDEVIVYEGNEEEAIKGFLADIEGTEEADIDANFEIYCSNNLTEVEPIEDDEERDNYMVLTDEEADQKWDNYLDSYIEEIILHKLPEQYRNYFDDERWKEDARMDGRGHSLGYYDGCENEQSVNGETFYIYRMS